MDFQHPPVLTIEGEHITLKMDRGGMIIVRKHIDENDGASILSMDPTEASEFGTMYAMAVNAINSVAVQLMHEHHQHNPFERYDEDGEDET